MYGLGTIDMKSYFACILNCAKELKRFNTPIIVAITSDEETSLLGVEKIKAKLIELNITPKLTIVGEPTNMRLCTRSKSCYEYKISIKGRGCHSSIPQNGINSNYVLARIVLYIEKLCKKFDDTTCCANLISGGEKVNIVSPNAELSFDLRSYSSQNVDNILMSIKKYISKLKRQYLGCEITLENCLSIPPLENKNPQLIDTLCQKFNLQQADFTGGCEAGYFQSIGGDALIFGVGDLSLAHKPNEFVVLDEFVCFCQKFVNLLQYLDKV